MLKNLKSRYSKIKNSKKGFTLIELVVVIAIMAILALIMVPNLTAYIQKGDDAQVKANMKNIHTAAELTIQSNPLVSVKDIAGLTELTPVKATDLRKEIGKFANVEMANIILSGAPSGKQYLIIASTTDVGRIIIKHITDKKTYTFDGVAYTPAN